MNVWGLDIEDLPEDWRPTRIAMVIEGVDLSDGGQVTALRVAGDVTSTGILGMFAAGYESVKHQVWE